MADTLTIVSCDIEHLSNHPDGAGYYFLMVDSDGERESPVGPFETQSAAEQGFYDALKESLTDMVANQLGLDDG